MRTASGDVLERRAPHIELVLRSRGDLIARQVAELGDVVVAEMLDSMTQELDPTPASEYVRVVQRASARPLSGRPQSGPRW